MASREGVIRRVQIGKCASGDLILPALVSRDLHAPTTFWLVPYPNARAGIDTLFAFL